MVNLCVLKQTQKCEPKMSSALCELLSSILISVKAAFVTPKLSFLFPFFLHHAPFKVQTIVNVQNSPPSSSSPTIRGCPRIFHDGFCTRRVYLYVYIHTYNAVEKLRDTPVQKRFVEIAHSTRQVDLKCAKCTKNDKGWLKRNGFPYHNRLKRTVKTLYTFQNGLLGMSDPRKHIHYFVKVVRSIFSRFLLFSFFRDCAI